MGETRAEMLPALAAAIEQLPADRPRYLMGVGDPASIVEAIALGVDQFDCVLQTRLGRHGTALTSTGKVQVKAARHGDEDRSPSTIDVAARCVRATAVATSGTCSASPNPLPPACSRCTTSPGRLQLMAAAGQAIAERRFAKFRDDVLRVWG